MKILKLLNKKYFSILLILFLNFKSYAEDKPVDIWNMNEKEIKNELPTNSSSDIDQNQTNNNLETNIYEMQSKNQIDEIQLDETLDSKEIKITGLYDPEDYDLDIYMWTNSDGDQLKRLFNRLSKIELSEDAKEIMNISILINAYYPKKNITEKEFLKLKSD